MVYSIFSFLYNIFTCRSDQALEDDDSSFYSDVNKTEFESCYVLGDTIGTGTYSIIKIAKKKEDDSMYAVKIVEKYNISHHDEIVLEHEIDIIQSLGHPRLIKIIDFFDD